MPSRWAALGTMASRVGQFLFLDVLLLSALARLAEARACWDDADSASWIGADFNGLAAIPAIHHDGFYHLFAAIRNYSCGSQRGCHSATAFTSSVIAVRKSNRTRALGLLTSSSVSICFAFQSAGALSPFTRCLAAHVDPSPRVAEVGRREWISRRGGAR